MFGTLRANYRDECVACTNSPFPTILRWPISHGVQTLYRTSLCRVRQEHELFTEFKIGLVIELSRYAPTNGEQYKWLSVHFATALTRRLCLHQYNLKGKYESLKCVLGVKLLFS